MNRQSDIVVSRMSPVELMFDADLNVETNNTPLSLIQTPLDCAPAFVGQQLQSVVITGSGSIDGGGGSWLRTMVGRTAPGAYLLGKLDRFKQRRRESNRRRITEKELRRLNRKIEKLLTRLDDVDVHSDVAVAEEEECVICLSAPATMQTFPCAHRVACRRCFVRTIQTAIAERSLPLRCVVCRSRILKLNDPMDPSALAAATQERLSAASGGSAPAGDRKTSASSTTAAAAALPAINPLLSRSAHVRRGAEKTVTSGHENKFNDSGKIVERRLMAPLHRRS